MLKPLKMKRKLIKKDVNIGSYKKMDEIIRINILFNNKKNKDGSFIKFPKLVKEVSILWSNLPKNIHNQIGWGVTFDKKRFFHITKRYIKNADKPLVYDGVKHKNGLEFCLDILSRPQDDKRSLFIKSEDDGRKHYHVNENFLRDVDVKHPFVVNGSVYIDNIVISKFKSFSDLYDIVIFNHVTQMIEITNNEIAFTHDQIIEMLGLTKHRCEKIYKQYDLQTQPVCRKISEEERNVLNGYIISDDECGAFSGHCSLPRFEDSVLTNRKVLNLNDGIEKEQAKKEYKRMIRPGSEHSSLYKSDKSYYLSTEHTITCINGQTFENFNNQIKELFNNKIYINLDSLNVMVKYIENPKKFEEIGFSEIMRDIKKSRNSRLNKSNIDYYRIKFNKSHMFISSETSLADIRKYGDRIFMDATGTKKRIKNNKKRLGIDETKASINIKNSKISKLFKKIAPGIFDILPENILYKLSHVAYKIYIKGMGELRSFLGLEQIHINGWADRYNIYSILKDELWNIRKNSSKNVVKKINDTFADYGHNMYVVKSEKVY